MLRYHSRHKERAHQSSEIAGLCEASATAPMCVETSANVRPVAVVSSSPLLPQLLAAARGASFRFWQTIWRSIAKKYVVAPYNDVTRLLGKLLKSLQLAAKGVTTARICVTAAQRIHSESDRNAQCADCRGHVDGCNLWETRYSTKTVR